MEAAVIVLVQAMVADHSCTREVRVAEDNVAAGLEAAVEVCIGTVGTVADKTDDSALAWAYTLRS